MHVAQGDLCPIDQEERQLALLRMLTSHFPNTDLRVSLAELEALLAQCMERKAEEPRNTDKELAAAKQKGVQQVREEMEQKIQQMISQLEDTLRKNHFSASERRDILTRENSAGEEGLDGIRKN